ncbi:PIN domain-containing protein [Argonema galeatum]|uniref:PIN domain-containing protein n=1 Tax=Argonema galeatum TaxID=2942762 RepID=UPI003B847ADB
MRKPLYYALIYRSLRSKGHPIPTNDMWIAATALQHDLGLFSYDIQILRLN